MSELITTLHPQDDNSVNLYPNVKLENIVDGKAEDAGKFVKVNEEGKFIVETVNIPEPQQVNNSTVTIKQGGVDKGSFTLNQAEDATIELDAGGAGESGSSMYATSSAISKGIPAHIEAANPIQVGDTISQLYFNTQQDIKSYLETCVDWSNGGKVTDLGDNRLLYPLLTAISDENEAVFRELKVGDYIYGLKIKADYAPGDGKVDPELNAWLANILTSQTSVDLFYVDGSSSSSVGLKASKNETGSGTEYTLTCCYIRGDGNPTTFVIYSSLSGEGFKNTSNWDSSKHIYELVSSKGRIREKELIITEISETESAGWNGVFFGAVSDLGEPVLSAYKFIGSPDSSPFDDTYILIGNTCANPSPNLSDMVYYSSALLLDPNDPDSGVPIRAGWHVTADQAVMLSKSEKVASVNTAVSKIASSEADWVSVPEILGNIYQDDILGTDEVKVNDILVDTNGTLGKVKGLSEELIKTQHPENPFVVGDEISANGYIYIDTSITPDLSKLDWSGFDPDGSGGIYPLVPLESFVFAQIPQSAAPAAMGIKINKPIYLLLMSEATYTQVDPSDVDKLAGSSLIEELGGDMNTWIFHSEQVTHEGSIFKVPLGNSEAVTLTDISDQDVWGSFISKDGKWVEDTPISRTRVSCEALRQLPTNYNNLDDIPIIKSDHILTDDYVYQFIPGNYINKYIQDPSGVIYFCDGQQLYELKGSSKFTVNLTARNGLSISSTGSDTSSYSATIGMLTNTLMNASEGDYRVFAQQEGNYGWVQPSAKIIKAGTGISASRHIAGVVDTTTISLSQDIQDKLAKIPDAAIETYSEGTGIALTQTSGNDKQISLSQDYITKLKPIMDAQDDLITDLVRKTADNEKAILDKYTKPAAGIPEIDLSAGVQGALTKANSSISGVKVNGTQVTVTDGVADIGTVITAHQSLDGKQDKLSDTQLEAVNSGITSDKVSTYNGYATSIQTLTTNLSSSDAKITQNTADITELKTTTVKKADMKGLELPDLPTADGNYALTCTITGGVATFAWTLAN